MKEVILHVYDVTNSDSEKTNNTILQINRIFKDRIGLGGIFHSAIQVYGEEEWSFGFCEAGSGVFSCPPGKNPMYTYREKIVLGETECSIMKVNQILRELSREWPGYSYDLLSKNCNHFCDVFCERLGVPKLPGQQPPSLNIATFCVPGGAVEDVLSFVHVHVCGAVFCVSMVCSTRVLLVCKDKKENVYQHLKGIVFDHTLWKVNFDFQS
ncbi:PPPDE putative thiol peptidase family protein [Rhynchospora pubera]|uniref:PPPDE putative thiol peptidase family protein n=1 Tax=Rhynchospora pubera TaxID=906938 RepID=A0AAV8GHC4_9POAL|nr:PPPDE putative thiol peptidase family protein [Rhynchospora pubera]